MKLKTHLKKVKSYFTVDKRGLPAPLVRRWHQAMFIFVLGMIAAAVASVLLKSFAPLLFVFIVLLLLVGYTFFDVKDASANGFVTISGKCTSIEKSKVPGRDPMRYIISSSETKERYAINYNRYGEKINVGDEVNIYLPTNSSKGINIGGAIRLGDVLGYEVISFSEFESNS